MSEDRNFRNGYYTKIDKKKSLDILLREKPPDLLLKVSQLTSRNGLSMNRRKQVWQLLLDVVKADNRIAENRIQTQRKIVNSILDALKLTGVTQIDEDQFENVLDDSLNLVEHAKIMIFVFLFESKQLQVNFSRQVSFARKKNSFLQFSQLLSL